LDDLPDWLPGWCLDHLGGEPVGVLFQLQQVSMVFGLRLAGGSDAVVKARADGGRAVPCVAAQARLAERGFPCARPLTPVVGVGSLSVHAEEFRPGGGVRLPVHAVHDWDSLAWQPEAALAGAASGAFASDGPPTLAPVESSEAFLVAYQDIRGRSFTAVEQEIAWAASVWMAAYNAREEALHGASPVCRDALRAQAAERLRRAKA
jgi:hypothetical protein